MTCISISLSAQQPVLSATGKMNNQVTQLTPILFQTNMTCLDLKSGLQVYYGKRVAGIFNIECVINLFDAGIGVQFFPIPTHNQGTLKARKLLPPNQQIIVQIFTIDGKILSQYQYAGAILFDGVHVATDALVAGTYVLKVSSEGWQELCKFIKY